MCDLLATSPSVIHGAMVGTAEIFCTSPVERFSIESILFRNGKIVASSISGCNGGTACADSASDICKYPFGYHYWYTSMVGTVVFPPGYYPPSITRANASATLRIYCDSFQQGSGPGGWLLIRHRALPANREASATDRDVKMTWAGNPPWALLNFIYEWVVSMLQPSVVTIPDVRGQKDAWARHQLRMLGLRVRAVEDVVPSEYVRATDPPPGTSAKRATVVTMYLVPGESVDYAC